MTKEQLHELAEALSILSAKSSIVKERNELKTLMEENIASEQDAKLHPEEADKIDTSLSKRIRSMITKIDTQLEAYDAKVGGSLKMIEVDGQGKISLADLEKAMGVIKHRPDEENLKTILEKLDTDHDGFVVSNHFLYRSRRFDGRPARRRRGQPLAPGWGQEAGQRNAGETGTLHRADRIGLFTLPFYFQQVLDHVVGLTEDYGEFGSLSLVFLARPGKCASLRTRGKEATVH